jgi:hypothetical protein
MMSEEMDDTRLSQSQRVVFRAMADGAGVLLDLDSGAYRRVNASGALIWELLRAAPTRGELIDELHHRTQAPPSRIADEVDAFLASLVDRGLVIRDRPNGDAT